MTFDCARVAALTAALSLPAALSPAHLHGQVYGGPPGRLESGELLAVPYLPQSEALCGGAAVAMVMRFWGERDIYAEEFAPLIDERGEGIATDDLVKAARRSGWRAIPFRGTHRDLAHHLSRGRPVIVLVEVAPDRFHYVVLVGVWEDRVVYHDPAVAPYRRVSLARFQRKWDVADRWAMLLLPERDRSGQGVAASTGSTPGASPDSTSGDHEAGGASRAGEEEEGACSDQADRAVRLARHGELDAAEELLTLGLAACTESSAITRELGGLRFHQGRWDAAARLAARAVTIDPSDDYSWELLAASHFRSGDRLGALEAWNRLGGPRVDLVDIQGLRRTRYTVVADVLAITPRDTLTPARFRRAGRRLEAMPTVIASDLRYRPLPDGSVELEAAVVERPPLIGSWTGLLSLAGRVLAERELVLPFASPTGGGSLVTVGWRWWENRPRVEGSIAAPGVLGIAGVMELGGHWEQQAYAPALTRDEARAAIFEERRHASLQVADWISGTTRLSAGVGLDRWGHDSLRPSLTGGARFQSAGDELAIDVSAASWPGLAGRSAFGVLGARLDWLREIGSTEWRSRAGARWASAGSPLALLPGAGLRGERGGLLRGHPLLDQGVIRSDRVGRAVVHGGLEITQWLWDPGIVAGGVAVFADGARLWQPLDGTARPGFQVDVGTGLRLRLAGSGRLRADMAVGLRDGATALSVVWEAPWPGGDRAVGR